MTSSTPIPDLIAEARAAETAGNFTLAMQHWRAVIAAEPDNLTALAALSQLLLESGDAKQAANLYQTVALALPDDDDAQRTFLDLLLAAGETEWARRHADFADLRKDGRSFRAYIDAALAPPPDPAPSSTAATPDAAPHTAPSLDPLFSHEHAVHLASLFQGRSDAFARQWVAEDGSTGYSPVYQPYSPRIVLNHLLGNYTTGIYLSRPDGHARILAFDFDLTADAIQSARGSASRAAELRATVTSFACDAATHFRSLGLNPILEDSGYKGVHIWLCFDDWSPAARLRRLGQCLLAIIPAPPETISVEIFPKQKGNPVKLGNLIKLPLGIHRKTGRRSLFLDISGKPFDDQAVALMALKPAPVAFIERLLDSLNLPPDSSSPVTHPNDQRSSTPHPRDTHAPAAAVPLYSDTEFDNDPVLRHLLSHCATLNALVRRIRATKRVSYDERITIEHSLGHLPNGPAIVNFLLRPCENFDANFLMRRPHRGHPVSCAKIIARLPYIAETAECSCAFSHACANYPTPLNHLYSYVPKPNEPAPALPQPANPTSSPQPQPAPPRHPSPPQTAFDVAAALKHLTSFTK